MCLRLMDAVPWDGVTAAVLHSLSLLFPGGYRGMEQAESGRVGVGLMDAVPRPAVD